MMYMRAKEDLRNMYNKERSGMESKGIWFYYIISNDVAPL